MGSVLSSAGHVPPTTEVAVLYYNAEEESHGNLDDSRSLGRSGLSRSDGAYNPRGTGAVRLMTYKEATDQMKGVSKLPREFWQHIRILQVPIQSVQAGVATRYITYNFDIREGQMEPQTLAPDASLRPGSGCRREKEATRVSAVPRKINKHLFEQRKGQHYLELVSGQLEFVLDDADGTLWLANASRLRCERRRLEEEDSGPEAEEVKYFEEEEFAQLMKAHDVRFEAMKKRFVSMDQTSPKVKGVPTFQLSAADRLQGNSVPEDLPKFYEAEYDMSAYYKEMIEPSVQKRDRQAGEDGRAVGLQCWFLRWVRGCKNLGASVHARRPKTRRTGANKK